MSKITNWSVDEKSNNPVNWGHVVQRWRNDENFKFCTVAEAQDDINYLPSEEEKVYAVTASSSGNPPHNRLNVILSAHKTRGNRKIVALSNSKKRAKDIARQWLRDNPAGYVTSSDFEDYTEIGIDRDMSVEYG